MGKEVMDCGEEFDMMEHGADVKHDVPRRGTGTTDLKGSYFVPDSKRFMDELPNSADQSGKWWYSAFHNTTAIVGAGVLGLPFAMRYLTWSGGVIIMCLSWFTSLYTLWQLCSMHELDGHRFCRYHELGQYIFGPRLGIWIVLPCQITMMVGLGIVYSVTGGQALDRIYHLYYPGTPMGTSLWILVFGGCQIFLSLLRNFNSLRGISCMAAVMALGYSTIATGLAINAGKQPGINYNTDGLSTADAVLSGFNSLGIIAFAYAGHNVVLEIQATLPARPPTLGPYMRGVYIAYVIVSWCYFSVAFTGYWAFGNTVQSNILFSLQKPTGVIALACVMVVIHVFGSYQVYTVPVYDMVEQLMLRHKVKINFFVRFGYRTAYVLLTTFVAISLPFFGDLMGFIGAIACGPTTFWLPPLMFLILHRPTLRSIHCIPTYFSIFYGMSVTILGAIGGLRGIITAAMSHQFYH